jgi:outer membrane protein OmpA-like peptidoglycan-associated protein
MMIVKFNFLLFFLLIFSFRFFSQTGELDRFDCLYSKEITIPFDYSELPSVLIKPQLNQVVFYSYRDQFTYWYKISCKTDGEIKFYVSSINDSDSYAVYIYQYNNSDFCNKLYSQKIKSITSPYFIGNGSELSKIRFKPLQIKKNNIYFISILNTSLNNCGHNFFLNYKADSLKIKAFHTPCKNDISVVPLVKQIIQKKHLKIDSIVEKNIDLKITKKEIDYSYKKPTDSLIIIQKINDISYYKKADTLSPKNNISSDISLQKKEFIPDSIIDESKLFIKLICLVKDKKKLLPLNAQLSVINRDTKEYSIMNNTTIGKWESTFKNTGSYKVKCMLLGYKDLEFNFDLNNKIDTVELLLEPLNIGDNFIMKSIYFHPNTYALRKESSNDLQKLLNFMLDNPFVTIEIQGHTNGDNKIFKNKAYEQLGEEWNFNGSSKKLSFFRAESIKKFLINNGVADERLVSNGMGGKKPIIINPETMEEGQRNIRVQVLILKN